MLPGANVAYVVCSPVRVSSSSARAGLLSSSTSRPRASLVATCTPCAPDSVCPLTVHERSSAPSPVYSKTRDGTLSPAGLSYVPS